MKQNKHIFVSVNLNRQYIIKIKLQLFCSTNLQIPDNTGSTLNHVMVQLTLMLHQPGLQNFSQLYASNNSTFLNKLSEENYDVQNETLDRDFTVCEVESAINHLKCGKVCGPDDIRNEFIKYEKQNLKFVLNQLFNVIYDTGIYPDK